MDPAQEHLTTEKEFENSNYGITFDQAWSRQPNIGIPAGSLITLHLGDPLGPPLLSPCGGGGSGLRVLNK